MHGRTESGARRPKGREHWFVDAGWRRSLLVETIMERCGFRIEATEYSADGIFAQYLLRRID